MIELIKGTPLPVILVLAGIGFLLLAIAGEIKGQVKIPIQRQIWSGIIGAVLLIVGLVLYLLPATPITSTALLTPGILTATIQTSVTNPTVKPTLPSDPMALLAVGRTWPLVLKDTFDNNSAGWLIGKDDSYPGTTRQIASSKYRWDFKRTGQWGWSWADAPVDPIGDFILTVRMSGFDQIGSKGLVSYGLGIRGRGADAYLFAVSNDRTFDFRAIGQESKLIIPPTTSGSLKLQGENTLTVIAQRTEFYLFVNDAFIGKSTDSLFESGEVGLAVFVSTENEKGVFEFDDFELRRKP